MKNYLSRSTIFRSISVATFLLLSCPSLLMGDSHAARKPRLEYLGREFTLHVGQEALVDGGRFRVKLSAVKNDSRCPVDVTCVWAGNAEVQIETQVKRSRASLKLNTQGGTNFPKMAIHQRYIVELVGLKPQPRQNRGNRPVEYVAALVVRKK